MATMQKWEYKVVRYPGGAIPERQERELHGLGIEGWELVSVAVGTTAPGNTTDFFYYLKRPIPETPSP
jgi:hypothetical protein